jgi:pimeloyl-ACP methyl ester carboxylesterase
MAKYAPERLHVLIIGGTDPYERRLPASSRLDGSDPEAFLAALFGRLEINAATFPPVRREALFANASRALAAAQQDRPSLEDMLPTITMPCLLYASDADPVYAKVHACAQQIPNANFFAVHGLDHSAAFRESGLVLPHITKFLQAVREGVKMSDRR